MTAEPPTQPQPPSFRDVLNLLVESQARENPDKPGEVILPTNQEIANAINAKHGAGAISDETIRKLRKGDIKSPSFQIASLIADSFGLPVDVFNGGSETAQKVVKEVQRFLESKRRTLSVEPEPQTVAVLARTTRRLSPGGQERVVQFAQRLEQLEAMENEASERVAPSDD
ncbi:hypothetical protein [Streptomyces sp. MBT33]|uniref:hypothetical protein n=1 Tax=Streptomyces sp. MBT33 TaxID=1488363 RepID=UPI001909640E|nr:hypothetical protein [Streptomyces sp. MBT33]MBK3645048.1 hypothetical protein [Streptomyces sp. MBT33]